MRTPSLPRPWRSTVSKPVGVRASWVPWGGGDAGSPSFVAAVYFWDERNSMPREELLDSIYFHSPFGATGSALHSIIPVAILLGLYRVLRLGRFDGRRGLL